MTTGFYIETQAKIFIQTMIKNYEIELKHDSFDYTKWQREHFDKMKPGEFSEKAVAHPYKGKGKRL